MFEVDWLMLRSRAVDFPAFSVPSSYPHSVFFHSVSKQAVPWHLHKCQCMDLPLREPVRGGGRSLSHCPLPPCLGLGTHVPPEPGLWILLVCVLAASICVRWLALKSPFMSLISFCS